MDETPLLTIHVSVYNLDKYIKQCLDSILSQEFKNYELLLVDNGSTDHSISICEDYARKDKRISFVKLPLPTIIGRPFAYACNHCKGKYLMVVDGDDYLVEGALSNIAEVIQKKNADLIMGTFVCETEAGMSNFRDADFDETKINDVSYRKAVLYLTSLPNFHTFQWRFIVDCKLFFNLQGNKKLVSVKKNEIYSRFNDGMTVTWYFMESKSIAFVPEPFYVYRRRQNSLSDPTARGAHAVDFLKTYVGIADSFSHYFKRIYSRKWKYIYNMTEARFELFQKLCMDMNDDNLFEVAQVIQNRKWLLSKLKPVSIHYKQFYSFIRREKDIYQALKEYQFEQERKLKQQINECKGKKIYVFPTGMCGESLCSYLLRNNLKVEAFLDNDPLKSGLKFENTECRLPQTLKMEDNIENCCVFITTAYRNNISPMIQQVKNYGILENNILIR